MLKILLSLKDLIFLDFDSNLLLFCFCFPKSSFVKYLFYSTMVKKICNIMNYEKRSWLVVYKIGE